MDNHSRSFEDCGFRQPLAADVEGRSVCGLLRELLKDANAATVSVDECQACCASQPTPTREDLNPVVASLLYNGVERLQSSQQAVCEVDPQRLTELRDWAVASIPVLFPHENDFASSSRTQFTREVTVDEIVAVLPPPKTVVAATLPVQWAVGVTTAPRRQPTLNTCLNTLAAAGWSSPHLFIDGAVTVPSEFDHLNRTVRVPQQGPWMNYFLSLRDLIDQNPRAAAYMLVQDDVAFPPTPAVLGYLDRVIEPLGESALVSLFCSADYDAQTLGWSAWDATWYVGAQAFVFSRSLAEAFLDDPEVIAYERPDDGTRKAGIDVVIGKWAERQGVPIFRPTPSLTQHIGHVSAIWATSRTVGLRRASEYVGDLIGQD